MCRPQGYCFIYYPKRSLTLSYNYGTSDTAKSSESGHHFIATDLTLGFLRTIIYPRFMITAPDLKQIMGRNIYILHNCDPRVRVRVRVHVLNICAGARVWLENLSFLHSLPEGREPRPALCLILCSVLGGWIVYLTIVYLHCCVWFIAELIMSIRQITDNSGWAHIGGSSVNTSLYEELGGQQTTAEASISWHG